MSARQGVSNAHTSKLDKYAVLGTVFKLDCQKSQDIEYMVNIT